MLSEDQLNDYVQEHDLSEKAIEKINLIRSSPPARYVHNNAVSVSTDIPSMKMGWGIPTEAKSTEYSGALTYYEYMDGVYEYYPQPASFTLRYKGPHGRNLGHSHTADFFILSKHGAGWEEWKTAKELQKLSKKNPNRYYKDKEGMWRCPPGERYAKQFGFYYRVRVNTEINNTLLRNIEFLDDYLRQKDEIVTKEMQEKLRNYVGEHEGITLEKLLDNISDLGGEADDIYGMIAFQQLFVDLHNIPIPQLQRVRVYSSKLLFDAVTLSEEVNSQDSPFDTVEDTQYGAGTEVGFAGKTWKIIAISDETVLLQDIADKDTPIADMTEKQFEDLRDRGIVTIISKTSQQEDLIHEKLQQAKEEDVEEALRRHKILEPIINGNKKVSEIDEEKAGVDKRTIARWMKAYRDAENMLGNGFVGLIPKKNVGNRISRIAKHVREFTIQFIEDKYEVKEQPTVTSVYGKYLLACEEANIDPISEKTFRRWIKRRPVRKREKARRGRSAANQVENWQMWLHHTTPMHGDHPWHIVHVDHTLLDIQLLHSITGEPMGRPWVTYVMSAHTRKLLLVTMSFDPPSKMTLMHVMRELVRRHGRFPQILVFDQGKEFKSVWFRALLTANGCYARQRPAKKPRWGNVSERLFKTSQTEFIYTLTGNTQLTKENVRLVTKGFNPQDNAVWTFERLYTRLQEWAYKVYNERSHPALGTSPNNYHQKREASTGKRSFQKINYSEAFVFSTMEAPKHKTGTIQPNNTVKNSYILYHHPDMQYFHGQKVQLRRDPTDVSILYAYLDRWVKCISQYAFVFKGLSTRAIKIATDELRAQNRHHQRQRTVTQKQLAEFLQSVEGEQAILEQRKRDFEASSMLEESLYAPFCDDLESPLYRPGISDQHRPSDVDQGNTDSEIDEDDPDDYISYGEF